ncbi:hypothetical protein LT493_19405 [Streptomyces tricolor]|nr:hypothetical protein [Streptomyces tricolor]
MHPGLDLTALRGAALPPSTCSVRAPGNWRHPGLDEILTGAATGPNSRTAATPPRHPPLRGRPRPRPRLGEAQDIHVAQRGTEDALGKDRVVPVAPAEWVPGAEIWRVGTGEAAGMLRAWGDGGGDPVPSPVGEAAGRAGGAPPGGADGRAGEVLKKKKADLAGAPGRGVGAGSRSAGAPAGVGGEREGDTWLRRRRTADGGGRCRWGSRGGAP